MLLCFIGFFILIYIIFIGELEEYNRIIIGVIVVVSIFVDVIVFSVIVVIIYRFFEE